MNPSDIVLTLSIIPILAVIGEPLRATIFKRSPLFSGLNLLQILLLDFFIGGLCLYLLALVPLNVFGLLMPVVLPITFIATLFIHRKKIGEIFTEKISCQKQTLYTTAVISAIFLTILLIRFAVQSNYVFVSNADQAFHSLIVHKILDQGSIVYTLEPYVIRYSLPDAPLQYQQGLHVILAYFASLFQWTPPDAIRYGDILFQALPVLGGYYLGKKALNSEVYGVSFAFVFAFISRWPKTMPWGSNAFTLGFPLFLIMVACLVLMWNRPITKSDALPLGLLLGFLGAIHPVYFFAAALVLLPLLLLRKLPVQSLLVIGLISLVFILPSVITRSQDLYNAVTPASGFAPIIETWTRTTSGDWLSIYPMLRNFILLLLPISLVWLLFRKADNQKGFLIITGLVIVSGSVLSLAQLTLQGLPLPSLPQWQLHMGIIYNASLFFVALLFADLTLLLYRGLAKPNKHTKVAAVILVALLAFPFVYQGGIAEADFLDGQINFYDSMTTNDLEMITWMKSNLPANSTILTHRFEGGNYLVALTSFRTVFNPGSTTVALNQNYTEILSLIANGTFTPYLFSQLTMYGFDYIWVAEKANAQAYAMSFPRWKASDIQANPNFEIVKTVGSSTLFRLNIVDSSLFFKEDFTSENLNWNIATQGAGTGSVAIVNSTLQIQATKADNATFIGYYIDRQVGLLASNITLSFNVDYTVTSPANYPELYIYDNDWKHPLNMQLNRTGEYSVNVGALWRETYNTEIPNRIIIQFIVRDRLGVLNTVSFDNIKIKMET
jgi:hypothetical protein